MTACGVALSRNHWPETLLTCTVRPGTVRMSPLVMVRIRWFGTPVILSLVAQPPVIVIEYGLTVSPTPRPAALIGPQRTIAAVTSATRTPPSTK